jgi:DNA-binding CsgD family transcriptional regulator
VGGATAVEAHLEERTSELFALRELVAEVAREGSGRPLLVAGEAGIGKTSLLAALRSAATSAGYMVGSAAGSELEADLPLAVARSLLRPLVVLRGARLEPMVEKALGLDQSSGDVELGTVLDALYWVCADMAQSAPLLLVADDVQWSDEPSARFLAYVMRRLEGIPLIVALGRRNGGPAFAADAAERHPDCLVLRPASLTPSATAALVRRHAPGASHEVCCAVHDATGGNPFYATALAHSAGEEPTAAALRGDAATRSILWRLARLGDDAASVARALAILGRGAHGRQVARLAGLSQEAAAQSLDALLEFGFAAADPWRLGHPIIHSTILGEIAPATCATMHARAARMLLDEEAGLGRVATHLLAAEPGQGDWARDALIAAGEEALAAGGFELARRCGRQALAGGAGERRPDALVLTAHAECAVGSRDAESTVAEAMAAADEIARAELALAIATHLVSAGRGDRAIALLDAAREALTTDREALRLRLSLSAAHSAGMIGNHQEQRARVRALDVGDRPAGDTALERLVLAELAYAGFCGRMPASELSEVARRALGGSTDPVASSTAAWALVVCGHIDEGIAALDDVLARPRAGVGEAVGSLLTANRAIACALRGRLQEAEADARLAVGLASHGELAWAVEWIEAVRAIVALMRGRSSEAAALLEGIPERPVADISSAVACSQRARFAAARGRLEDAADRFALLGAFLDEQGIVNPIWWPWRSELARVLVRLGRPQGARALAEAELANARDFGASGAAGPPLVALGLVEGGEAGLALLRQGVDALAASEFVTAYVDALIALGSELRRQRRAHDAREPLRTALDLAARCGLHGFASLADAELRVAGGRPRRSALSGVTALTASELRVARLAAGGLSNRAIAQALFVTPKTVERHLGQVYRKLSVGRSELPQALGGVAAGVEPSAPGR